MSFKFAIGLASRPAFFIANENRISRIKMLPKQNEQKDGRNPFDQIQFYAVNFCQRLCFDCSKQ